MKCAADCAVIAALIEKLMCIRRVLIKAQDIGPQGNPDGSLLNINNINSLLLLLLSSCGESRKIQGC